MPSKWTFDIYPIADLLKRYNVGIGWADPFSGKNLVAEHNNNLAESEIDAYFFLQKLSVPLIGVLFDPPYSLEQCNTQRTV
jgi:hypothetical protein